MVKTVGKNVLPNILKTLNTNTDLYVHIMHFNSSKIFNFLGWFRTEARIHIMPWVQHWFIGPA